jgi:hypothetical protein
MNWTIEEVRRDGMSVRPLDWTFHRTLALAVVEANLKHAPDVVHETGEYQILISSSLNSNVKNDK